MSQITDRSKTNESDQQPTTSNSAPESTTPEPAEGGADTQLYQCPFCDATYTHEYFCRAHVTICDDAAHVNRNGLMPDIEIDVVTPGGDHVETVAREVRTTDLETLTRADVPDSNTSKQTTAILGAAQSPHFESRRSLADQLAAEYDDPGLIPSEWTVGRAIDDFYLNPMIDSHDTSDDTAEQLADLTSLQQAVVLLQISSPELTDLETAQQVDCSDSHVWNVRDKYSALIETLSADYEAGKDLNTIVTEALSRDAIAEITRQYGDALPAQIETPDEPTSESESDTEAGDDTPPIDRGVPSEADVMSASPNSPIPPSDTEDSVTNQRRLTDASPDDTVTPSESTSATDDDDGNAADDTTAVDVTVEETPSTEQETATTPSQKSIDESLGELRYAISVGRGMLAAAAPEADVQSQAETFAAQIEAKCAELQQLRNTTE
jgi:hypothetical protein